MRRDTPFRVTLLLIGLQLSCTMRVMAQDGGEVAETASEELHEEKRKANFLVLPVPFSDPSTGFGIGALGVAFYNPNGTWDVENHGVDPDVTVELDPYLWKQGRDAQLEKAVELAMYRLKTWKKPVVKKPAYMDKSKIGG